MIAASSELYAGGTSALAVLASAADFALWRPLLEDAEVRGLSGLLTADPLEVAALRQHGITAICVVAAGEEARAALELAAEKRCEALCLVSPPLLTRDDVIAGIRVPRLFIGGSLADDVAAVRALNAASAGPTAMRFFPTAAAGPRLLATDRDLIVETIGLFAVRCMGAGGRPGSNRALGAHSGEFA